MNYALLASASAFDIPQPEHLLLILRHLRQLRIHELLFQYNHLTVEFALKFVRFRGILRKAVARRVAASALVKLALIIFRTFAQPLAPLFEGGDALFLSAYVFEIVDRQHFQEPSLTCAVFYITFS